MFSRKCNVSVSSHFKRHGILTSILSDEATIIFQNLATDPGRPKLHL